jgi:hypothetical protein
MKKQLLHVCVLTLAISSVFPTEAKNSIRVAATLKTAFDFLSYPLSIIPICAAVEKKLTPALTYDIFGKEIAQGTAIATGFGLGLLGGMAARELYIKAHKLVGFSESEVEQIRNASYEQQAWIVGQAAAIAFAVLEVFLVKSEIQREKERKEREEKERPVIVAVMK